MKRPSSAKEKKLYKITQQKNLLLPKYLPNINSMNSNNQMRDDALDEELKILQYSWNEVGITQEYRNKAAHTNELGRVDAETCFKIVIITEQLLKKMLDTFEY